MAKTPCSIICPKVLHQEWEPCLQIISFGTLNYWIIRDIQHTYHSIINGNQRNQSILEKRCWNTDARWVGMAWGGNGETCAKVWFDLRRIPYLQQIQRGHISKLISIESVSTATKLREYWAWLGLSDAISHLGYITKYGL